MSLLKIFKGKESKGNLMPKLQRLETTKKNRGEEDIYLKIDNKNNLNEVDEDYISELTCRFDEYKKKKDQNHHSLKKIMNKFFEKNELKYDDYFSLSQDISKQIIKNLKIDKEIVYRSLKQFIDKKDFDHETLLLNRNSCAIIGQILSYGYSKMSNYKIKDMKQLKKIAISIVTKNIDIIKLYKVKKEKLDSFCKSRRNDYEILPEIIFLINRYASVKEVEINLDKLTSDNLIPDDFLYMELTLLNIYWLLNSLNSIKCNFILSSFEELLFYSYNKRITKKFSDFNESVKKNNIALYKLYDNKWNFIDNFKKKEPVEDPTDEDILMQHRSIDLSQQREKMILTSTMIVPKRSTLLGSIFGSKKSSDETKLNYDNIVQNYQYFLDLIMMCFISLNNAENCINLELVMNDCFTHEFLTNFSKTYEMEWINKRDYDYFHIFNLLLYNNIMNQIDKLNIEINCLEPFTFDKLLNFLYYNSSSTGLNISLFSADVTYTPEFIYKAYEGSINTNELKKNYDPENYLFDGHKEAEEKMLKSLETFFVYHLSILFEVNKKKKMLKELGFNFDIPANILNKKNYMNAIYKFILNLLFFISKSSIKKFVLLAPNNIIDGRTNPNINDIMNGIKINNNSNNFLENLSLQMQFYKIVNIKNFVSTQLKILNIGDLDLETFKLLSDRICSCDFNKNSNLEQLSISLLNVISNLSFELKIILEKLFRIKINSLRSLNVFTNLYITNKYEYLFLVKILNKNWISEYNLTFNSCSQSIINDNKNALLKVNYLVNNNNVAYNEAYWILKHLFDDVFVDKLKNNDRTKGMIYDIFKYIYDTKQANINVN